MLARRRFLSLLGAAPAAIPVIAREAAAKLGLEGALGGTISSSIPLGLGGVPPDPSSEPWPQRALRMFWRPTQRRERRNTVEWQARRLDPDLASMRSISPSAAYQLQRSRCAARVEHEAMASIKEHMAEEAAERMGLGL